MATSVRRRIAGHSITARPVADPLGRPLYWTAILDNRTLAQTFESATAVFRHARRQLEANSACSSV